MSGGPRSAGEMAGRRASSVSGMLRSAKDHDSNNTDTIITSTNDNNDNNNDNDTDANTTTHNTTDTNTKIHISACCARPRTLGATQLDPTPSNYA